MKKTALILLCSVLLLSIGCSSPDDTPEKPEKEQLEEKPEEESTDPPAEEEVSGADLLYNGTAVLETQDPKTPFIFYNQDGTTTAAIDENLDGNLDKIILNDDDLETVIEMNSQTGLPTKMYTSEGILVIYNFKENNTLLDVALVQKDSTTLFIEDVNVSDFNFTAKTTNSSKALACPPMGNVLTTMANGYSWALGGWCRIKEDNNVVFQSRNLTARECNDIYRERFPCCLISVYEDAYCKQLTDQAKVLSEIESLVSCAADGNLADCIDDGLAKVQALVNAAQALESSIGEDLISQAENILADLVENNPAGNDALVGTWFLEKFEDVSEGVLDLTAVNVEYCDDPPFENECSTITESTLALNADGTLTSILTEIETFKNNNVNNTIVEKEFGKWSYNEQTDELLIVLERYEYLENGVVDEASTYEEPETVTVESFTVSETNLVIVFDSEDNDADGIAEESYTEFYKKG